MSHYDPFQQAYLENEQNGWKPGQYKMQAANGGWEVLEHTAMTSGTPAWVRVFYSRDKAAAQRDLDRRTGGAR